MTLANGIGVDDLGTHVVTTRNADLYDRGDGTIAKVFLAGTPQETVIEERTLIDAARHLGATAPATHEVILVQERWCLLMDKAPGQSLTSLMEAKLWRLAALSRELADHHVMTHAISAPQLPDIRAVVVAMLKEPVFAELGPEVLGALEQLILALPAGTSLLHMDFHTENVFSDHGKRTTIDWATAAHGHPAADVAMTTFLLTGAEPFPGASWIQKLLIGVVRGQVYRHYRAQYLAQGTVSAAQIALFMPLALAYRLGSLHLPSERKALIDGLRAAVSAS